MSEKSSVSMVDRIFAPGFSHQVERLGEAADQAIAEAAEEQHKRQRAEEAEAVAVLEKQQAERVAADARRRVRLATRSLKLAAPGIVLSSLGFTFAFGADGNGRVALMALLLFAAGTVAYVWSISLASGRLKPDSGPGTQGRST